MDTSHRPGRRAFMISSAAALPAAGLPLKAVYAAKQPAVDINTYRPVFFSESEWKFVMAACDRLIPADGKGPGAIDTNVPVFIDQQVAGDLGDDVYLEGPFQADAPAAMGYQLPFGVKDTYRRGIRAAESCCQRDHKKSFADLSADERDAFLTKLQKNELKFSDVGEDLPAANFFVQLLADTKHGYLADPMYGGNKNMQAWVAIGFPGARAAFTEWVDMHDVKYPLGPVSIQGDRA